MPRPLNTIPTRQLNVALPLPLYSKLVLELTSEIEGRVPFGAYSNFFSELLRQRFEETQLDVGPLLNADIPPGTYFIRGPRDVLAALERKLS